MIRLAGFALIVVGLVAPTAWAQSQSPPSVVVVVARSQPSPGPPAAPVLATPQAPLIQKKKPAAVAVEVTPPPPMPATAAEIAAASSGAANSSADPVTVAAARRSITRLNPLPQQRAPTLPETDSYAGREALMDQGHFANPGGVGRVPEYYTANTLAPQSNQHRAPVARFQHGGGPDRAEQIAAFRAGQERSRILQDNINAYGRPYGAFGVGYGYGYGLGIGRGYGGYPR